MGNRLEVNIKSFKYESDGENILTDLNLVLENGSILWVNGAVGCGKTTLLKIIGGIIPDFERGFLDGEIILNGEYLKEKTYSEITFCFQHSDNQMLFDSVKRQFFEDEKGLYPFLKDVGLMKFKDKSVIDLSRGQRKFVALMSTLCKRRKVYIFDEPLDLLDYERKKIFLEKIHEKSKDSIIIISSHDNDIREVATITLTCAKSNNWKLGDIESRETFKEIFKIPTKKISELVLETNNCMFNFKGNNEVLKYPGIKIYKNEIVGLVGKNGCGKTTLLKLMSGTIEPSNNKNSIDRKFEQYGFMFQNVNRQLFESTVYKELFVGLDQKSDNLSKYANKLLNDLKLVDFRNSHPIFLSGGQKQKLVFASLLMHKPDILFLDEIFTNLDIESINSILDLIVQYRKDNDLTVVLTDQETSYLEHICERIIQI